MASWRLGVLALLTSFMLIALTATMFAHDPKRKNRKPTKATPMLKRAREKMDAAKAKMKASGNYDCCAKPTCDLCARTAGGCQCAQHAAQGHGVCGECLESWQAGLGKVKGVKAGTVKLLPPSERWIEESLLRIEDLAFARDAMNAAKRTLSEEGRYACCVNGGCDSCAHAGECACGANLARAPAPAKAVQKSLAKSSGVCGECLDGWHAGHGVFEGITPEEVKLEEMDAEMPSSFGVGTMFRQGSGTGWLPETTPMFAFMKYFSDWMVMSHATAFTTFTHQPGKLGDQQLFSTNWMMVSAQREVRGITSAGPGTFLARGMFSLDPLTVGGEGYPLLLQTGETYKGAELSNRQHPHDFLMELAVAYSAPVTEKTTLSVYFAPVGEPALGPTVFAHRLSAADNPEAPLGHHWQDSTHISFGVVTGGLAREKWKVEGSVFTGREPDENRWNIDPLRFDSWSTRLSVNPFRDWSFQVSYGSLQSPEALQPYVDLRRVTASATHHRLLGDKSFWATSFIWGRNIKNERGYSSYSTDSYLIESAYSFGGRRNLFGRYEHVAKDNLFPGAHVHGSFAEIFPVQRFTIGGVQVLPLPGPFEWGIGGAVSFNFVPPATRFIFGEPLRSGSVFLRVRSKRWGAKE